MRSCATARAFLSALLAAAALAACGGDGAGGGSEVRIGWTQNYWRTHQPAVPHPRTADVRRVFDAVRAVADEDDRRPPHLLLVDTGQANPWALSLPDGGIVLSVQALDVCYRDADRALGDARLGFVLGHEMAHLASEHFQHVGAYFAVQGFAGEADRRSLSESLAVSGQTLRGRELLADQRALVYLTVAGLDPAAILDDQLFFERWTSQSISAAAYGGEQYPTARERAESLKAGLQPILDRLPLFDWGVRLYQVHRFGDSVDFLSEFKTVFAGAAVLNNLGLAHFQRAFNKAVQRCPDELFQLRLPHPVVDPDTLARHFLFRGIEESCLEGDPDLVEAVALLERAAAHPSSDRSVKLNQCSALVAAREAREAYQCTGELLKMGSTPEAELLELQAEYLISLSSGRVDVNKLLEAFETLAKREPESALIVFNHAAVVESLRGSADASPLWRRFLGLEPSGPYADHARRRLGEPAAPPANPIQRAIPSELLPPVRPGRVDAASQARLGDLEPLLEMELAHGAWRVYRDGPWRILYRLPQGADPREVVLVEREAPEAWSLEEIQRRYGQPSHVIPGRAGEFLRYPGFGFEIRETHARTLVFF